MDPRVHVLVTCAFAAALVSCTSGPHRVQPAIRFRYPSIDIYGPYARDWVLAHVNQVVELARVRADIKKPIDQIEVYTAGRARVKSGNPKTKATH
jgi:hypothetical protein